MTVKYTLNFRAKDGGTWEEEYWSNAASVSGIGVVGLASINKRLAFLDSNSILTTIRAADDTALRVTKFQDVEKSGQSIILGGLTPSDTAMVVEVSSGQAPISTRRIWIRGTNSSMWAIDVNGVETFGGGIAGKIQAWIGDRASQGWGIKRLKKVRLVPPNVTAVTVVDGSANPGHSVVTTIGNHGLAVGDTCIMYRQSTKDLPALRGFWVVEASPTPTTFIIPYRTPRDGGPIPAGGVVRKAEFDVVQTFDPTTVRLLHIYHHDTKDAFFGSRGNRRAARIRHSP